MSPLRPVGPLRTRRTPLRRLATATAVATAATALLLGTLGAPVTAAPDPGGPSGVRENGAGDGRRHACVSSRPPHRGPALDVLRIAQRAKTEMDLKSVILRVSVDGREVVTSALGASMTGVPARPDMHFRNGNIAISYMGTALLRLVDQGKADLDEPVSRWLPDLPDADRITLRMLGSSTTGLVDYVRQPAFQAAVGADPFRQWTADELVEISTSEDRLYAPGTNWNYSHANFVLLGAALEKISGLRLDRLLQREVMGPLGLRETRNSSTPDIPTPVLHAFSADRGPYEESTFWNPSWTTAPGAVQTTDICDLERSASAIGSGELLSEPAYREFTDPGTVGLGTPTADCPATVCIAQTEKTHYGMGVLVLGDWISQHPLFFGYSASMAYLPSERISIAVSTTEGPAAVDGHSAHVIAQRIAAALTPDHPIPDFG
ncbi:serine hydrolase domain-containing protein [Streptomyces sp. NPDC097619]|uniref:serine hydrolase domain-containing protein n=1 Tax=Streptomyces sp. NPDC097619 TaxID=3157228 RepID=UPI0033337261